MEFLQTEVLVIGGGIAGLRAAIAAREAGAEVMLLAKRKAGKSGSSLIANTGHRLYSPDQTPGQDMLTQTLQSGQGLANEGLVKILAEESLSAVCDLEKWGVPIAYELTGGVLTYARCPEWKGLLITEKLRQRAEELGVQIYDGYCALKLAVQKRRVVGTYAASSNGLHCFLAKTVVLAAGGIGQIYHPTDNPVEISGESIALAWGVGAELMDLEFVQFYPYQLKSPISMDIHTSIFSLGAYLVNEQGDRFMEEYPEKELVTRDILSREMYLQEGNITLDLEDVDLDKLRAVNPKLLELYLEDQELVVSPIQHFTMGGVRMDSNGRSTAPGLFVCGEAAAGVHGANRLGGNALTECNVFGRIAGYQAAREAQEIALNLHELDQEALAAGLYLPEKGEDQYLLDRTALGHLMWDAAGIVRDGEGLHRASREIKKWLHRIQTSKPCSVSEWYQTCNMLIVANLIAEVACYREESRGAHYRLDFPETDPIWAGHLIVRGNDIIFME